MNMVAIILIITRLEFCTTEYTQTREVFENKLIVLKHHPFHETINITLSVLGELNIFEKQKNIIREDDYFGDIYHILINFIKFFYYKHE